MSVRKPIEARAAPIMAGGATFIAAPKEGPDFGAILSKASGKQCVIYKSVVEHRSGKNLGFPWVLCERSRYFTTFTPPKPSILTRDGLPPRSTP